jgi:hypothetical protein
VPAMVAVFVQILRCSGAFRGAAPVHELKSQKLKSQELKSHDIAAFKS